MTITTSDLTSRAIAANQAVAALADAANSIDADRGAQAATIAALNASAVTAAARNSELNARLDQAAADLAARDATIAALRAQLAGQPQPDPEPGPDPEPEPEQPPARTHGGGPTGTLSPYTGPTDIRGGTLSNVRITKPIRIFGDVIMRNVELVTKDGYWLIGMEAGSLLAEDFRIDGSGGFDGRGAIVGSNVTMRRGEILGVENGAVDLSDSLLEDVYIHGLQGTGHADGLQFDGRCRNVTLRRVRAEVTDKATSAIMIDNQNGPIQNLVIDDCRFRGGMFAMYLEGGKSNNRISVTVKDSDFSGALYGPVMKRGPVTVTAQSGNTANGAPLTI